MPDPVIDQAVPVHEGEALNQDTLTAYLGTQLGEPLPPLQVEQFPSGFSNLSGS